MNREDLEVGDRVWFAGTRLRSAGWVVVFRLTRRTVKVYTEARGEVFRVSLKTLSKVGPI